MLFINNTIHQNTCITMEALLVLFTWIWKTNSMQHSLLPKTVIQLVKKIPVFCRTKSTITMFTGAWTRWSNFTLSQLASFFLFFSFLFFFLSSCLWPTELSQKPNLKPHVPFLLHRWYQTICPRPDSWITFHNMLASLLRWLSTASA